MLSCFWKNSICPVWIYLIKTTIKNSNKLISFCGDITFCNFSKQHLFVICIFVTFDQFNAHLLNKSIKYFFKKEIHL